MYAKLLTNATRLLQTFKEIIFFWNLTHSDELYQYYVDVIFIFLFFIFLFF